MADHVAPGHDHLGDVGSTQDVGCDLQRRAEAVVAALVDVAAVQAQEALEHAGRVVKPARARPAITAAVDRLAAVLVLHTLQLTGDQVQRFVPAHRDERLTTSISRSGAIQKA
jgi:hypothetical protein